MSSLEKVSGANVVPSAVPVSVIALIVPPTLDEFRTSIVIDAAKANDPEPESVGHCGLQRVAVTGFGRTTRSKVAPPMVETLDGPVELVLQAAETVETTKPRIA